MNITITQDNSRVEVLGSSGASIIEKLYELAIDPNNTLTLEGNISSTYAYGYLVDYLNTNYGPDFIVNATNRYIYFEDPNVFSVLSSQGVGDGTGITINEAASVNTYKLFSGNTDIVNFDEFKYFTYYNQTNNSQLFENCTNLESIDLTNITTLGFQALRNCSALIYFNGKNSEQYTLSLPHLTSITDRNVFTACTSLQHVTSLGNLVSLGNGLFEGCTGLLDVVLPNNITSITNSCFNGCKNLTSVSYDSGASIWESLTSIGYRAFAECENLNIEDLSLPNLSTLAIGAFNKCYSITKVSNLGSINSLNEMVFQDCSNLTTIDLTEITSLGKNTFSGCSKLAYYGGENSIAGELNMPNLTSNVIYEGCFRNNKLLTKITSLGDCTSFGYAAFWGCTNLTEIDSNVLNKIISLGAHCFEYCTSLQTIDNLGPITNIPEYCFFDCSSLTNVVIPDTVTTIEQFAFRLCTSLTSVTLNNNITEIKKDTFSNTGLTSIDIPESVTIIRNYAFARCNGLTTLTIPGNVKTIEYDAFYECRNLNSLTLSEGIESIEREVFLNTSLSSVIIPSTVTNIGNDAFNGISTLTSVTINAVTPPTAGSNIINQTCQNIYVPSDSVDTYKAADGWSTYADRIQAITE